MKKRILSVLMCLMVLATLFSACSQTQKPGLPDTDEGKDMGDFYDELILNNGDKEVYANFVLHVHSDDSRDISISWQIESERAKISEDGVFVVIDRPAISEQPADLKLTATLTHKDLSVEKSFELKIMPFDEITTYYVAKTGSDKNPGTEDKPFLTINKAAQLADAGDTVIIGEGVYREYVDPARGGLGEGSRITYKAADWAEVWIKGSDELTNLKPESGKPGVYSQSMNKSAFGDYNPYTIAFLPKKNATLGEVFVNGQPFVEAANVDSVASSPNSWKADEQGKKIYVNLGDIDPATALVEYNVREQVFAPSRYALGYITIDGIKIEHAANQYPMEFYLMGNPPQKGALSTFGGHHWNIQNCTVQYAKSANVDFGYGGVQLIKDNKLVSLTRYYENGLTGYHKIKDNYIFAGGTEGMISSYAPYVEITGNRIIENNRFDVEVGYEAAGLKTFFLTNAIIADNYFARNNYLGLWVDNTAVNSRVTGNVFVDHPERGMTIEMLSGPLTVDSNVFLRSHIQLLDASGVRLMNNFLYKSSINSALHMERDMAIIPPYSMRNSSAARVLSIDMGFYKNYFSEGGLTIPKDDKYTFDNHGDSNLYADKALYDSYKNTNPVISQDQMTGIEYTAESLDEVVLRLTPVSQAFALTAPEPAWVYALNPFTGGQYVMPTDYFGNPYTNPAIAGPFADLVPDDVNIIKLFPKQKREIPAPEVTYVDDRNILGSYSQGFELVQNRMLGDIGGNVHIAKADGESVTFRTDGAFVRIMGEANATPPVIEIKADGQMLATITPTAQTRTVQTIWYEFVNPDGQMHEITLTKAGGGDMIFDGYFVPYICR